MKHIVMILLLLSSAPARLEANAHANTLPEEAPKVDVRKVSGVIPGAGRGAILGAQGAGQQGALGQQQGQGQAQGQLAQQLGALLGGASTQSAGSASRQKAQAVLEIQTKNAQFFENATKSSAEAFKQIQQSFSTGLEKLKPNPDNNKITEGLAEDQQKLAEANAKAPPVGSDIVADLIKGLVERSDTDTKTIAQIGLQMAPPAPRSFARGPARRTIASQLEQLQLASIPAARSEFSAGDRLVGDANTAIPALPATH